MIYTICRISFTVLIPQFFLLGNFKSGTRGCFTLLSNYIGHATLILLVSFLSFFHKNKEKEDIFNGILMIHFKESNKKKLYTSEFRKIHIRKRQSSYRRWRRGPGENRRNFSRLWNWCLWSDQLRILVIY